MEKGRVEKMKTNMGGRTEGWDSQERALWEEGCAKRVKPVWATKRVQDSSKQSNET